VDRARPGTLLLCHVHRGRRQSEEELASLVNGAFDPDTSAMLLDDAAAEREAEAGATERARVRGVTLLEALEDVLEFFWRDAASLVFDNEADLARGQGIGCPRLDMHGLGGQEDVGIRPRKT